jgi:hypothetical protein
MGEAVLSVKTVCMIPRGSHPKNMARMSAMKANNTMRKTTMKVPHIAHFGMVMSQSPMVMSQSLVKRSLVKRYATECRAITR